MPHQDHSSQPEACALEGSSWSREHVTVNETFLFGRDMSPVGYVPALASFCTWAASPPQAGQASEPPTLLPPCPHALGLWAGAGIPQGSTWLPSPGPCWGTNPDPAAPTLVSSLSRQGSSHPGDPGAASCWVENQPASTVFLGEWHQQPRSRPFQFCFGPQRQSVHLPSGPLWPQASGVGPPWASAVGGIN